MPTFVQFLYREFCVKKFASNSEKFLMTKITIIIFKITTNIAAMGLKIYQKRFYVDCFQIVDMKFHLV